MSKPAHMVEGDAELLLDQVLNLPKYGRVLVLHADVGAAVFDRERAIRRVGCDVPRLRDFLAVHLRPS